MVNWKWCFFSVKCRRWNQYNILCYFCDTDWEKTFGAKPRPSGWGDLHLTSHHHHWIHSAFKWAVVWAIFDVSLIYKGEGGGGGLLGSVHKPEFWNFEESQSGIQSWSVYHCSSRGPFQQAKMAKALMESRSHGPFLGIFTRWGHQGHGSKARLGYWSALPSQQNGWAPLALTRTYWYCRIPLHFSHSKYSNNFSQIPLAGLKKKNGVVSPDSATQRWRYPCFQSYDPPK